MLDFAEQFTAATLKFPNSPGELRRQDVSAKKAYVLGTNQKAAFTQGLYHPTKHACT